MTVTLEEELREAYKIPVCFLNYSKLDDNRHAFSMYDETILVFLDTKNAFFTAAGLEGFYTREWKESSSGYQ